jgi:hypothetical protein
MAWWSRALTVILAAGMVALVVAFVWALWSDGTEYVDLGNLELRFDFEGDDLEKTVATIVAVAIGLAALLLLISVTFGLGSRRRYHQMARADGTQLLVDTDIVSQRLAAAASAVPGVRKVSASVRPASNNEVHAGLDLQTYSDADPAATAQQASQAAVEVLQRDFETRPAGGLRTRVRQTGKATPGGKPKPVTDKGTKPAEATAAEPPATEPVATEPEVPTAEPVAAEPGVEVPVTETEAVTAESTAERAPEQPQDRQDTEEQRTP